MFCREYRRFGGSEYDFKIVIANVVNHLHNIGCENGIVLNCVLFLYWFNMLMFMV